MSIETAGEKAAICPAKVREDIVRIIAAANGATEATQIDIQCPTDCPRREGPKLAGVIALPSFIGRCQMPNEETPMQDPSDGHNLSIAGQPEPN